jgi:hypothetical protein
MIDNQPVSVKADVSAAYVKGARAPGRSQNRLDQLFAGRK